VAKSYPLLLRSQTILRSEFIKGESVELIYLDPPFNSKTTYNLLFRSPQGHEASAQIEAFEDTWHWGERAEREFAELHRFDSDRRLQSLPQTLKKLVPPVDSQNRGEVCRKGLEVCKDFRLKQD